MRKDERFWQEGMDGKRFALCLFRDLRLIAAAGLLGAAVSAGLYLLASVVLAGPPEYQVFSQYRIYFDSEKYGQIEDYYNAYTWGEIMKTDEVLDYVLEALPEGITKEQVKASVSVGAMNDVKIMPLYITTQDPALSETIAEAYVYGLDRFGHSIEGLDGMDCWLLEEAKRVPRGTKAANAAILGLILGAAAGFFGWLVHYCLDDSILLEADLENRCGIPVLGILTEKRDPDLIRELATSLELCLKGREAISVLDAGQTAQAFSRTVQAFGQTAQAFGRTEDAGGAQKASGHPEKVSARRGIASPRRKEPAGTSQEWRELLRMPAEMEVWPFDGKAAERMRQNGVLLLLPWGKGSGRMAGRLLDLLGKLEIPVLGAVIYGAKDSFLGAYYGRKGGRA